MTFKIAKEDWSSHINLAALQEQTQWFDEYNCHQLAFFRVFYAKGQPAFETIGEEDRNSHDLIIDQKIMIMRKLWAKCMEDYDVCAKMLCHIYG